MGQIINQSLRRRVTLEVDDFEVRFAPEPCGLPFRVPSGRLVDGCHALVPAQIAIEQGADLTPAENLPGGLSDVLGKPDFFNCTRGKHRFRATMNACV